MVLYDEKKIPWEMKNSNQEEENEMTEDCENCRETVKVWSCFDDAKLSRLSYLDTAIEIEE